jgi:hypothetical protein
VTDTNTDTEFLTYVDGKPFEDVAGEKQEYVRTLRKVDGSRPVRLNGAGFKLAEKPRG